MRAPLIVHESTRILRLLDLFRESKMHFAAIVDEHGSIEGVVTPSDILTAIAGELPEAADEEVPEVVARDDSSWLVDGGMSIDDVERLLGAGNMRSGDDYTTLAGFVLAQLGHLPAAYARSEPLHSWLAPEGARGDAETVLMRLLVFLSPLTVAPTSLREGR